MMGTSFPLLGEGARGASWVRWMVGSPDLCVEPTGATVCTHRGAETHGSLHGQSPEHFPNLPATQKQGLSAVVANGDPTSMGLG